MTMSELAEFRREVSAWLTENRPAEPDFLLPETFMEVGTDAQFHYLRDWQQQVYEAGYLGMSWPQNYGGGGKSQAMQDIVTAEMARLNTPFMMNTIGLNWAGPLILSRGTEDEKQRYIQAILSAEEIWCQGFSEPDHGSDLGSVQTRAVRDGDSYVVNGSKIWTSLGQHAKHMILLARTDPEASNKYAGLSFFLAPMDAPGIDVQPIRKITGEFGFNQTFFNDARIPATCRMGAEGEGWAVAMSTLTFERGVTGGQAGGTSMISVKVADVVELARVTKRNGKPAIEDPWVRDQLVRFISEEQGDRLTSARAKHKALVADRPESVALSGKLRHTEHRRRLCQFAIALQGANAARYMGDAQAVAGGKWQRSYFKVASGSAPILMRSPRPLAAARVRCRRTSLVSVCLGYPSTSIPLAQ